ncbi:unnamed protein product [Caenorhabditis angaria]|uniref:Methyltransferase FkbM domain-containing protein n=1 Tax=Caenorhabditis angaria TaxID=860376 RepID=A0A9P1N7F4_9PELO|nr:unnamed protein product [Caenorhabditis angaria]
MLNRRNSSKLVVYTIFFLLIKLLFKGSIVKIPNNIQILENSADCVQIKLERLFDDDYWELIYQQLNCSIISLGIGKDVKAEKKMKYNMPECLFYGADPIEEDNKELFEPIGDFYNMAVGDKNGSFRSYVLEDIYRYQEVTTVDLVTFINQKVQQKIIDQMMIDIEHAEYKILNFFGKNEELERNDIYVCQINIEIHKPESFEDRIIFSRFLEKNFKSKQWIFINSEIHPILKHIRLFMINGRNPECIRRYLLKS